MLPVDLLRVVKLRASALVVILQEWWGVTKEVKEDALYIAEKGQYRVLVPDLCECLPRSISFALNNLYL